MSDKGREYEIDGWMYLEMEGEEDNALDLAKDAFQKAIDSGNIGAYVGLACLPNDGQMINYLKKAANVGRLDAMWELYLNLDDPIEKYSMLKIVASQEIIADAKDEFDANELNENQLEKVDEYVDKFLLDLKSSGFKLGTGENPIF